MQFSRLGFLASATLALTLVAACGKNSNDPRGALDKSATVATLSKAAIDVGGAGLPNIKPALCDVELKRIDYQTIGGASEATTASAAVAVPSGGAACDGDRPVILYAHGTDAIKASDMATPSDGETFALVAYFASQGYILIAPNYTGYAGSKLAYHPYLVAEAQAADMVDAMRAAKADLAKQSRVKWKDLYVAGYSQGGYVSMATHRALERDFRVEFPLAGTMHMSGPYDLPNFAKSVIGGAPNQGNLGSTLFTPMLVDSYQATYKNIYTTPNQVYRAPFDATAVGLFPGSIDHEAAIGAAKVPVDLKGASGLLSDTFVADFTAAGTSNKLLTALNSNILYNFIPRAKTGLCYGNQDPVVFGTNTNDPTTDTTVSTNTAAYPNKPFGAVQYFKSIGATTVTAFDLHGTTAFTTTNGDNRDSFRTAFTADTNKNNPLKYHEALVPYCMGLAKLWFDEIRTKQ